MRNPLITQVTPEHVTAYIRDSLELGWKRNSLVPASMAIKKFFEFWKRRGYPVLDYQILPVVRKEGVEPRVATPEVVGKVLEQCEGRDIYSVRNRALLMMLMDTGMRNGELCSMNMDVVEKAELHEGQYSHVIRTEKNRGSKPFRRVFWYEEANNALNQWISLREEFVKMFPVKDEDALFIGTKMSHGLGYRMTPFTVGVVLRKLSVKAGVPTLNAHSLRHYFGMQAAEAGANNSNISDLMGHATLNSSFVYTHLKGKQLGAVHKKVKGKSYPQDIA